EGEIIFSPVPVFTPLASPSPKAKPKLDVLAKEYTSVFMNASFFTLKRVLSDEALKVIVHKRAKSSSELAKWYSLWVVRMARYHVDFGISLRNKADEKFHYDWAMTQLSQ